MQLQFAILADAAQVTTDGKFNVVGGGIEMLTAPRFPAITPTITLVVRLALDADELGLEHLFHLELLTPEPEGRNVLPPEGNRTFTSPRGSLGALVSPTYLFVINFPGLVFQIPGRYTFRVFVDGKPVGDVPIELRISSPATQAEAS